MSEVARYRHERGAAGGLVDQREDHRVGAQPDTVGALVAAHQQHGVELAGQWVDVGAHRHRPGIGGLLEDLLHHGAGLFHAHHQQHSRQREAGHHCAADDAEVALRLWVADAVGGEPHGDDASGDGGKRDEHETAEHVGPGEQAHGVVAVLQHEDEREARRDDASAEQQRTRNRPPSPDRQARERDHTGQPRCRRRNRPRCPFLDLGV